MTPHQQAKGGLRFHYIARVKLTVDTHIKSKAFFLVFEAFVVVVVVVVVVNDDVARFEYGSYFLRIV